MVMGGGKCFNPPHKHDHITPMIVLHIQVFMRSALES